MDTTTIRYTYEDYLALSDNGRRYEIIDGDLFMTPSPAVYHQIVLSNIEESLRAFVRQRKLGVVLIAPTDVVLSEEDVVQPDILFVSAERKQIITEKNIGGPPDLVVEVLSDRTRSVDRKQKRQLYEKYGVREYWLVEPDERSVEILYLEGGSYRSLGVVRSGVITSKLLNGFETHTESVFAN